MEILHHDELLERIRMGENTHQDFKHSITDSRKIARSLSAFANTEGGSLLIGVKDNGKIVGIRSDEEYYMIESAAGIYCRPELAVTPKIWRFEGKTVLEALVEESRSKPHYVLESDGSKNAYVRLNDQNIKANQVLRKVWEIQKQKKDRLVRYSDAEKSLFNILKEKEKISLSFFKRKSMLSNKIAVRTLANMLVFGLIEMELGETQTNFKIKADITSPK